MQRNLLPDHRRLTINGQNFISLTQSGSLGCGFIQHTVDDGGDSTHAIADVYQPEHKNRQQEIGSRAGSYNGHSLPQRLAGKRLMTLALRNGTVLRDAGVFLTEHFDVPAERYRGNDVFHSIFTNPGFSRLAKSNRKAEDFYATATRHPKMAKLMNGHEDAQSHNQGKNANQYVSHLKRSNAPNRAR